MIALFTDFGLEGPYLGQMKAVLAREAPGVAVIDLMADVPAFEPKLGAYLLAALVGEFPEGTVFLSVVDPGVGSARGAVAVRADGRWLVGPDNGLLSIAAARAAHARAFDIVWRPERLSASFHGRDLFAPVAAALALGRTEGVAARSDPLIPPEGWPEDLPQVIYVDRFGNLVTGLRARKYGAEVVFRAGAIVARRARTFSDVSQGDAFWYENSNGLVEIAVNRGNASHISGCREGDGIAVQGQ